MLIEIENEKVNNFVSYTIPRKLGQFLEKTSTEKIEILKLREMLKYFYPVNNRGKKIYHAY